MVSLTSVASKEFKSIGVTNDWQTNLFGADEYNMLKTYYCRNKCKAYGMLKHILSH
jgi:hypothetical protein